jgi:hypothetical protein
MNIFITFSGWLSSLAQAWPGEVVSHLIAFALGALKSIVGWGTRKFRNRAFHRIFGVNAASQLVVGELTPTGAPFSLVKPSYPNERFRARAVISRSEVRAATYLSSAVSGLTTVRVATDEELKSKVDISFIAIGAMSNHKSRDVFENESNQFTIFDMSALRFISKLNKKPLRISARPGYDYGILLKICPQAFPDRTWIICSGLDEWGTSGTSWFLANKWKQIHKKVGDRPFAALIEVRVGQDESATMQWIATDAADVPTT